MDLEREKLNEVPYFHQLLNQYHSAHLSLYSYKADAQFNVFFGGISQYFYNDSHELVQDPDVPFVSTVSVVERNAAQEYREYQIPMKLPKGIGAGTEFIPQEFMPRMEGSEVLNIEALQSDSLLIGYLYGGISTTAPNVFFENDSNESSAKSHVYSVWWKRNQTMRDPGAKLWFDEDWVVNQGNNGQIHFQTFVNTENQKVYFVIETAVEGPCLLRLRNMDGTLLLEHDFGGGLAAGENIFALPLYDAKNVKEYRVEFESGGAVLKEILRINP